MYKKNSFLILTIFLSTGSAQSMFRPLTQKIFHAAKNVLSNTYNKFQAMSATKKVASSLGIFATSATAIHGIYNLETGNIGQLNDLQIRMLTLTSWQKKHVEQVLLDKSTRMNNEDFLYSREAYSWARLYFYLPEKDRNRIKNQIPNPWCAKANLNDNPQGQNISYDQALSAAKESSEFTNALQEERNILDNNNFSWYKPEEMPFLRNSSSQDCDSMFIKNIMLKGPFKNPRITNVNTFAPAYYTLPIIVCINASLPSNASTDGQQITILLKNYLEIFRFNHSSLKETLGHEHAHMELKHNITSCVFAGKKSKLRQISYDLKRLSRAHEKQADILGAYLAGKSATKTAIKNYRDKNTPSSKSHPSDQKRADYLEKELPHLLY